MDWAVLYRESGNGPQSLPCRRSRLHCRMSNLVGSFRRNRRWEYRRREAHGLTIGGESGIRTHGGIATTPVFKTGALNRSAISPHFESRYNDIAGDAGFTQGILPFGLRASGCRPIRRVGIFLLPPSCISRASVEAILDRDARPRKAHYMRDEAPATALLSELPCGDEEGSE